MVVLYVEESELVSGRPESCGMESGRDIRNGASVDGVFRQE